MNAGMQKVTFKAQQVTSEFQGVQVEGMCVWSIYRTDDGPAKAYRYLDGLSPSGIEKANANIKDMAESILRAQVATMSIADVVRNRAAIRTACRKDMADVIQGWGLWLETLEIYDVKILSATLFDNLQVHRRERRTSYVWRLVATREKSTKHQMHSCGVTSAAVGMTSGCFPSQAEFREKVRLEAEGRRITTETELDRTENEATVERQKARQAQEIAVEKAVAETEQERRE